jgi:DNA adenine methylase
MSKLKRHRSILKWAGNKTRVIDEILLWLPTGKRLVEPFVGSAAVFSNTEFPRYLLCDSNADLIGLYELLKKHGDALIEAARPLFTPETNTKQVYYALREEFNLRGTEPLRHAALFLYLNRHGYNGLCRYNSKGGFNVPFGSRPKVYFPEAEMRRFIQRVKKASLRQQDFTRCLAESREGDVIYCDPPYIPLSDTASFTAYQQDDFSLTQQRQLAELARDCAARGIPVLISNHDTPLARELYADAQLFELQVQRHISCKGNNRGKAPELLAFFDPETT